MAREIAWGVVMAVELRSGADYKGQSQGWFYPYLTNSIMVDLSILVSPYSFFYFSVRMRCSWGEGLSSDVHPPLRQHHPRHTSVAPAPKRHRKGVDNKPAPPWLSRPGGCTSTVVVKGQRIFWFLHARCSTECAYVI